MIDRTRTIIAVLAVAVCTGGCETSHVPLAPSALPQVSPAPPPTPGTYTVTSAATTVSPGGPLSVSWTASFAARNDWIGLFTVSAAACDHGWSDYTRGAQSGTLSLTAPLEAGQYEFRFFPDNSCDVAARSEPVSVR